MTDEDGDIRTKHTTINVYEDCLINPNWKAKRNVMGLAINNCKLYFAEHSIRGVDGHDLHQLKAQPFVKPGFWKE